MARVFISYKRADKEEVFRLKEKIEAAIGESCWIDVKGIESDAQFVNVIMQAIDDAEIILFMYSKEHSCIKNYEKDWTVREINYAQAEDKRIVFVNIDQTPLTKWFKFMFGLKQQIDATSEEAFGKLLEDLKGWLEVEDEPEAVEKGAPIEQKMPEPEPIQEPEPKPFEKEPYTEGLEYEFDDKNLTATVKGIGAAKEEEIIIPDEIQYKGKKYKVVNIASQAFAECQSFFSIIIPDSILRIGKAAFSGCNVKTVILPKNITVLEEGIFHGCRDLKSIIIPKCVEMIGEGAFSESGISSLEIPANVSTIHSYALTDCHDLQSIMVEKNNPFYCSQDGVLFNNDKTILLQCPIQKQGTYSIPDTVQTIDDWAFAGCKDLTAILLPESIKHIKRCAFSECKSLTDIKIPKNIIEIEEEVFGSCEKLSSVILGSNVVRIGAYAFAGCKSLKDISLPPKITIIGNNAFYECSMLSSVYIPNSLRNIEDAAFEGCLNLKSVEISNKTIVEKNAFPETCKVKSRWFG